MTATRGWRPDPYGVHEYRFFSADGKPTLLVMDGQKASHDPPPSGVVPVPKEPHRDAVVPMAAQEQHAPPPPPAAGESREPTDMAVPAMVVDPADAPPPVSTLPPSTAPEPLHAPFEPPTCEPPSTYETPGTPSTSIPVGRGRRIAYGIALAVLGVSLVGLLIVHFPHGGAQPQHRSAKSATTTTSIIANTTTTVALPSTPKPDPDSAANALVSSWATGNRAAALGVATASAVNTLFGAHYAAGLVEDRGCSTAAPIVCSFGPPGGASPTDAIYQIDVAQAPGGWYVSEVKIQN